MKKPTLFIGSLLLLSSLSAYADKRVALVIANSDYTHLSKLKNPPEDAKAVAKRLKAFGFTLLHPIRGSDVQNDLSEDELITARNALLKAASGAKIAFIYYSGHGASLGKHLQAHILPVNIAKPTQSKTSLQLLKRHSLSLDSLLTGLDQKAELTLAVFDACREIPELEKTKGIFGNDLWRGLGRVKYGRKRIIAYSGSQGQVVADGQGKYSPYTQRLLEVMDNNPSLEVGNLFREVATKVESYTHQTAEVLIQGVPPNRYYLKQGADNNEGDKPQKRFALTVNTSPAQARVKLLHIKPVYHDGIRLQPDEYEVEVSQSGYITKKGWVTLGKANKIVDIVLKKKQQRFAFEPKMQFIKGGRFQMGSPASEKGRYDDEKQHSVQVGDFWMAKTETTFKQWQACVDDGGCQSNKKPKDYGWGRGNRPVIRVSWHDANEYADWLSKKTGENYHLPTEAQWEYAARGGSKSAYAWGNQISCDLANYGYSACKTRQTKPVASYQGYAGLYDMHGNVQEWTCSAYDKNYGGSEKQCAKRNEKRFRVLRGGSWDGTPRDVRSAGRYFNPASNRSRNIGFRLSRTN